MEVPSESSLSNVIPTGPQFADVVVHLGRQDDEVPAIWASEPALATCSGKADPPWLVESSHTPDHAGPFR